MEATTIVPSRRPVLTIKETAALLNKDYKTVRLAVNAGQLPSIVVGKRRLVPTGALMGLLATAPRDDGAPDGPTGGS